jgi:tRNA pseudouridine38-40 synthase
MQTYKAIISYDGTSYHGWQRQPKKKTIQGEIEKVLSKMTGKDIPVIGAGRTDAGVHALGQTAHFKIKVSMKNSDLLKSLNACLPSDIRIVSVWKMAPEFHARKMARSKIYQYRIWNSRSISPFQVRYVHQWYSPLDTVAMRKAAKLFIREADFSPFSSNRFLNPTRTVFRSSVTQKEEEIIYTVESNGFLRYMVRTMVGTLLEIARGKIEPDEVEEMFKRGRRSLASPTAPAKGLCLMKVRY